MKIYFVIVYFMFLFTGHVFSQDKLHVPVLNFQEFEPRLHLSNDTVYVINFWATWCVPCRKELPEFEKIHINYKNEKVKVLLVSLDFVNQVENSLKPFIIKNQISSEVVVLNAPDANNWINKVDPNWGGSIPATLFYKNNTKLFFEDALSYDKIDAQIKELLIQNK